MRFPAAVFAFTVLLLGAAAPASAASRPGEDDLWYIVTLNGEHAGWLHACERTAGERLTTEVEWRLAVSRAGTRVVTLKKGRFIETTDGQPISFWSMQDFGSSPQEVQYTFREDGIDVATTEAGRTTRSQSERPAGEWMTPHEAGEFITARLLSGVERFSVTGIDVLGGIEPITTMRELIDRNASVEVLGKKVHATRWKTVQSASGDILSTEYFDPQGVLVRSEVDLGGVAIVTLLSSETLAKRIGAGPELMLKTFVQPNLAIATPDRAQKAVFDLSVADGELPAIPASGSQRVERFADEPMRVRLTIDVNARTRAEDDAADYLNSSELITSSNEQVRELAARAVRRVNQDTMRRAEAIRTFVNHYIRRKSLGIGLASAAQVAQHREGDCTEHAVLTAAMLRAEQIPARIATGLVFVDEFAGKKSIFGYHMWTQALIDGCWIDFDATTSHRFDATHIALNYSAAGDADFLNQMTTILPLMGRLKIDVIDIDY